MADALHIVCPHCDAVNRVPESRLTDGGKCGACHTSLFEAHPTNLTESRFAKCIARNDIPVVVDFWAPWCGPCRAMALAFEQAVARLEPAVRFAKLNTDEAPGISAQYQISSIPTVIVFRSGREAARKLGAMPASQLIGWIETAIR